MHSSLDEHLYEINYMCELAFIEYNPTFDSIMLFDVTIKTSK
jgi:hypothetical protein